MNTILVQTTFKNSFTLLKPFYLFYKDVWNPQHFIFGLIQKKIIKLL